jgi:DNA replication and repair protein RecF
MSISEVKIANLRSYTLYEAQLDPQVTLILGPNGSGKTTILEALYVAMRGSSFRGRDRDMIAHTKKTADIKTTDSSGDTRRVHLSLTPDEKLAKSVQIDGKTTQRVPNKYRVPVVLFEPDELRLLSSSPQRRRDFLDGIMSRLTPAYATLLNRYARTLLQRNELLKQRESMDLSAWESHLFAWDVKFAELAGHIVSARQEFVALSNQHLSRLYSSMADAKHTVEVRYDTSIHGKSYQQKLLHTLEAQRIADSYRGYTSAGPHRDDISILLDTHSAAETASRGEMRTIMLAYKLLEVELQEKQTGKAPLILMDDVFSELDITREQHLMRSLAHYQTVITATDLRDELKINAQIISL